MSDTLIIPAVVNSVSQLARQFNLQNVQIIQPQKQDFNIPNSNVPDQQLYQSPLGTPVLVDLKFNAATYIDENGNHFGFDDFVLATVLLTITQTKNITKTQVQGRKGTIKEYTGLGDYAITINGIIIGPNGTYPRGDIQTLKTILTCPDPLTVTSWYLQMFDINSIVIEGFDIGQEEGGYSRQPFTIGALSDDDDNLRF